MEDGWGKPIVSSTPQVYTHNISGVKTTIVLCL